MRKLIGSALVSLATTALAAALLAPTAVASPIGDAEAAIMAAWDKAGGDTSPLGARKGDVYPVGDGFALDFDGGKMFYTTATGAKFMYGPILDKYESLGGAGGSDLGFPTINEVPGLAGPDSRVSTFSATDKPVIFWTPDHGAFVVRGAMNAAWDKLGSSGGVLGAPVGDETYDGEVTSQKFNGGQVSWNRQTKQFATEPPALADQLKGLQVPIDPTAAINMAWRAAGGPNGPLGAKQGGQYPIGGDGIAQNFAGGKVFFSPATGANAVESDILAKYESLGGPVGSDLGFPTANEADGGITPTSRIATFSAADKPVIFWTPDHGAFVVRGAMKAAWDKLRGPAGKLGAPVGDQALDGDVVSQQFTGGKISWNRAKNTFTTDPSNLAPLLSGLQVSGQNQPSNSAMPSHAKKFTWHWWWLLAAIPVLVLIVLSVLVAFGWRRRHPARETAAYEPGRDAGYDAGRDAAYNAGLGRRWGQDDSDLTTDHYSRGDAHQPEPQERDGGSAARVSWPRAAAPAAVYGGEVPDGSQDSAGYSEGRSEVEEDPDSVDTDSIPIVSEGDLFEAGYAEPEAPYAAAQEEQAEAAPEADYTEAEYADAGYVDAEYADAERDDAYPEAADGGGYPEESYAEEGYVDESSVDESSVDESHVGESYVEESHVEEAHPGVGHLDASPEAAAPEAGVSDAVVAGGLVAGAAAAGAESRTGRHAAVDDQDAEGVVGANGPSGRPTIHLPLEDPYQVPEGYPIKASARFGLYYTPGSDLYHDTLAELWMSSEEVAQANGFVKAD